MEKDLLGFVLHYDMQIILSVDSTLKTPDRDSERDVIPLVLRNKRDPLCSGKIVGLLNLILTLFFIAPQIKQFQL